jgi:hypothetical protein
MANVTILQLPAAGAITGTESVPIVQNGVTVQTTTGAIAASPSQPYTYLTVVQTPQLANSRYFGATNGLTITDGGAQNVFNVTTTGALLSLVNSGTGFQVKTSATAITNRQIDVNTLNLSVTNADGVSGNPTISVATNPIFSGIATAGSFTGAGTGLTGTAAALSIGGNAATATTAVTVPVRTTVLADGTSVTVNVDTTDLAVQTNTQTAGTLTVNAPTGTPINGQKFILRLQCTNAQTFSWNSAFAGSLDLILPTATTGTSKYDYVGFIYNSTAAKWQLLAKVFGF